jgi:plastocyanin
MAACVFLAPVAACAQPPRAVVVLLEGNAFKPAQIHARAGDTLRFVNGNGGPHNVAFVADSIAAGPRALLDKAMGDKIAPLSGPLLLDPDETYLIVVPAIPAGHYPLFCVPHFANMRGSLIVSR